MWWDLRLIQVGSIRWVLVHNAVLLLWVCVSMKQHNDSLTNENKIVMILSCLEAPYPELHRL